MVAEPQRGFRATPISGAELVDLTRVLGEIEASCLRRAMAAGDVAWEARIVAAFHRLSRTPEGALGDPQRLNDEWSAAHAAFHGEIVGSCGSPWLLRLRALLFAPSARYRRLSFPLSDIARDVAPERDGIAPAQP